MSLIAKLKKLVDPVESRRRDFEQMQESDPLSQALDHEPANQNATEENEPANQNAVGPSEPDQPQYRCKVCGLVSADPSYCPECLADTMRPMRRSKGQRRAS